MYGEKYLQVFKLLDESQLLIGICVIVERDGSRGGTTVYWKFI
jgi:hypothetical protein